MCVGPKGLAMLKRRESTKGIWLRQRAEQLYSKLNYHSSDEDVKAWRDAKDHYNLFVHQVVAHAP